MLAIRMQRTGRKGYAQFRIVVQDSRQTPSSARVIASIGHYNPHTKETVIDAEKAKFYLKNGAQPSARVVSLLKKEGVKMPSWVEPAVKQKKATKNPEKLRKNRPAEAVEKEAPSTIAPAEATTETLDLPQETTENAIETPTEVSPEETATVATAEVETKADETAETNEETPETKEDTEPEAPTKIAEKS